MLFYGAPSVGPVPGEQPPCVLCGLGANCIDHWMRYCMVTHIVLLLLLRERAITGLHQLAEINQHGLALATLTLFHLKPSMKKADSQNTLQSILSPMTLPDFGLLQNILLGQL